MILNWINFENEKPIVGKKVLVYFEIWDNPIYKNKLIKYICESKMEEDGSFESLFYNFNLVAIKKWAYFEYPE
jgi:hypothetical protein